MSEHLQDKMAQSVTIQHPGPTELLGTAPLPYTINPWNLFISDTFLLLRNAWSLPFIVWPIRPCNSGSLDELSPTWANVFDITVHLILSLAQFAFLISIPFCVAFPFGLVLLYVFGFIAVNHALCKVLLNGWKATLDSRADLSRFKVTHEEEKWIFLNGVAVGEHWLQSNIDRISLTFGRKVLGVHNPTAGIVFDVVQCIMQRDFTNVTQDIRNGYAVLKEALRDPKHKKIVFIIHSQGGIEGGLILDWLFAEVSRELMEKLEVYTFGNAANHFNNPVTIIDEDTPEGSTLDDRSATSDSKTIKYIEHYANDYDFVSRWGVLHFASRGNGSGRTNRYSGHVFERQGRGHQFNQHYMDTMFPLDRNGVCEESPFMDSEVQIAESPDSPDLDISKSKDTEPPGEKVTVRNLTFPPLHSSRSLLSQTTRPSSNKVSHYSRLWQYRNGRSPEDR